MTEKSGQEFTASQSLAPHQKYIYTCTRPLCSWELIILPIGACLRLPLLLFLLSPALLPPRFYCYYIIFLHPNIWTVCVWERVCVWKYQVPGDGCQSGQVVPLHLRLLASLQWEHAVLQLNRGSLNHEKSAEIALSAPRILEHRHIYFSPR